MPSRAQYSSSSAYASSFSDTAEKHSDPRRVPLQGAAPGKVRAEATPGVIDGDADPMGAGGPDGGTCLPGGGAIGGGAGYPKAGGGADLGGGGAIGGGAGYIAGLGEAIRGGGGAIGGGAGNMAGRALRGGCAASWASAWPDAIVQHNVAAATQLFSVWRTPDRQPFTLPCLP